MNNRFKKSIASIAAVAFISASVLSPLTAQVKPQDTRKAGTEAKMDCSKSASGCAKMNDKSTAMKTCDPAKCKEAKGDSSKCKNNAAGMTGEKKCDPSKCQGMAKK